MSSKSLVARHRQSKSARVDTIIQSPSKLYFGKSRSPTVKLEGAKPVYNTENSKYAGVRESFKNVTQRDMEMEADEIRFLELEAKKRALEAKKGVKKPQV